MTKFKTRGKIDQDITSQLKLWSGSAQVRKTIRLDIASRESGPIEKVEIADDELIEVELENGVVLWTRMDQLVEDCSLVQPQRAADELPLRYRSAGTADRGLVGIAIKAIKILGYDIPEGGVTWIAEKIESKLAGDPGFYHIDANGVLKRDEIARGSGPVLVLIHGTASTTEGAFHGLIRNKELSDWWNNLQDFYHGRVFAFEHRTLTESPIENAVQLLDALPKQGVPPLHLISHSRGGLVGDLISHGGLSEAFPLDLLRAAKVREEDQPVFDRLNALLAGRMPRVERFIRVACPARGTTLASKRLDIYLSLLFQLLSKIPGIGMIAEGIGELLSAVAKKRADPDVLPGIAAQMPESPLIRLLNGSGHELDSDLTVIAGDSDGLLKNLANIFFWRANDLVVDTRSMYDGTKRVRRLWYRTEGRDVHHCNYFERDETVRKIVTGLTRDTEDESAFSSEKPRGISRGRVPSAGPKDGRMMPAVVLVPGVMGSHLSVGHNKKKNRIWLDILDLMRGCISQLEINEPEVYASGLIERAYGDFSAYMLSHGHQVIPFPYDWRKSVAEASAKLASLLQERLKASKQPIRIVAHSMGGLVARYLIAEHKEVWRRVVEGGGRMIQFGTPNKGSYIIPRLLQGREKLLQRLALLDLDKGKKDWIRLIARYPGLMEMAPQETVHDFFKVGTWNRLEVITAPRRADLAAAREVVRVIQSVDLAQHPVAYVAGRASATPTMDPESSRIEFTPRGDGRVTWDDGIPEGVPRWYVNVKHGSLLDHQPSFEGLLDLIVAGETNRLDATEPTVAGRYARSTATIRSDPAGTDDYEEDLFPSQALLENAALGMDEEEPWEEPAETEVECSVRVVHGDLEYSQYPVMVGHYAGDPILHAEKAVDNLLGGALSTRNQLNLYPRGIGTHEIFLDTTKPTNNQLKRGGIVIGLGQAGSLTPGGLSRSVENAVVRFAKLAEERMGRIDSEEGTLGLTSVLIGSGDSGLPLNRVVEAILTGVKQANCRLRSGKEDDKPCGVTQLELVEIYEDLALEALHELHELAIPGFAIHPILDHADGGQHRASRRESPGWWRPLTIKQSENEPSQYQFSVGGGRARIADLPLQIQPHLIHQLLDRPLSTVAATHRRLSETLFELLLPRRLKDSTADRNNLVVGLDEASAQYPWELLLDRQSPDALPLSVQAGLVRLLHVKNPPEAQDSEVRRVLVVGDPPSKLPALQGAEKEARTVANFFDSYWEVVRQIRNDLESEKSSGKSEIDPQSIISAAMTKDYRIVHLAGHGIYDPEHPQRSGMVLSGNPPNDPDSLLFSPAEVAQMRRTPDLVFINCCHLGRIESTPLHLLASNLATQFIHSGVRLVIAAGWAVEDNAAMTFAKTFYESMFAADTFGEAVLKARRKTFQNHPESNTWAAYQCYGDPGFRFMIDPMIRYTAESGYHEEYIDAQEVVIELSNLTKRARVRIPEEQHEKRKEKLKGKLSDLEKIAGRNGWIGNADVSAGIARVYGELGDFENAIAYYEQARESESGLLSVENLRQLANLRARYAAGEPRPVGAVGMIEQSINDLKYLVKLSPVTETLSALGSAYKQLVKISDSKKSMEQLPAMAAAYAQAASRDPDNLYPMLNALFGILVLRGPWDDPPKHSAENPYARKNDFENFLSRTRNLAAKIAGKARDFWERSYNPDAELAAALASKTIGKERERLLVLYRKLFESGSPRLHSSVISQIKFLEICYRRNTRKSSGKSKKQLLEMANHLLRLLKSLEPYISKDKTASGGNNKLKKLKPHASIKEQ